MATWAAFADAEPEMAAAGTRQLEKFGLAYLGTVRADGAPRVHPVCPFLIRRTAVCRDAALVAKGA